MAARSSTKTNAKWPLPTALPDFDLHIRRPHHRIAGLARERLRERWHIRRRCDCAELRRRVYIGVQAQLEFLRLELARPDAAEIEEEALLLGVAVDDLLGFLGIFLQRDLQRVVSGIQAAEVGDVLAERLL